MNLLAWVVFGFFAGVVARWATPGKHPRGCIVAIAIGIAGAVVGGLIGQALFDRNVHWSFSPRPFLLAVVGAVCVLLVLRVLAGRHRREE